MRPLKASYKTILTVSIPMMLGSAAQQIIVLSDNIFLYHTSLSDFGAIALVGVFYLLIASIGFGFSRGGQILIARRFGEGKLNRVGSNFHTLILFQILLAIFFFSLIHFFADDFFKVFIKSEDYNNRVLDYIYPRSYGIFFSYVGFAFVALYTGIARTKIIVIDTLILAIVNLVLNYILIFGKMGFEPMGIEGAAWASTIAEIVAFVIFLGYIIWDKGNRYFSLFKMPKWNASVVKNMNRISIPIVLQSALGLGSWFIFFSMIEQYKGKEALEISNLIRNVYLFLSIPSWGFAAGLNTIVSNMMGQQLPKSAFLSIGKTMRLCFVSTMIFGIPICLFPDFFLSPIFGGENASLIQLSIPSFYTLLVILTVFSISSIYMNGVIGTGATPLVLRIQFGATLLYLLYSYYAIKIAHLDIATIWFAEVIYWLFIFAFTSYFIYSKQWVRLKF